MKKRMLKKLVKIAVVSVENELDKLLEEKQDLIDYLKNNINLTYDYFSEDIDKDEYIFYLGKMRAYQQVLSIIEKSDK